MALTAEEIIHEMRKDPPLLVTSGNESRVQGCSYDMTIGTIFWDKKIIKQTESAVIIPPGGVVSILTHEEINLPDDVFATAFAINSMSSKGLLVLNPGHVDPGFKGPLSVRALNIRKTDLPLYVGKEIFTVIFHRLSKQTKPYEGNITDRKQREDKYNEAAIELTPKTIFEMMAESRDGPFPSRHEVEAMIRKQILAWIGAIAAVIGAVLAGFSVFNPSSPATASHDASQAQSRQSKAEISSGTQNHSKKSNPSEDKQ